MHKSSIFGSPIITAIARSSYLTDSGLMIPGIVARCMQEINKDLDVEGLFRRSGAATVLKQLQEQFDQADNPFQVVPSLPLTVHYWTGLLKRYLQLLPEPLIPRSCQSQFLEAFGSENQLDLTYRAIKCLPLEHRHLLQYLLQSIQVMVQHGEANHMSASTLAIIIAPTCIQMDAISHLMQSSARIPPKDKYGSWQKVVRRFIGFSNERRQRRNAHSRTSLCPLYQPQDIMQLELVKSSAKWAEVMEYLISNAHLLIRPFHPKHFQLPLRQASGTPLHKLCQPKQQDLQGSQRRHMAPEARVDIGNLQFSESKDLIKIFQDLRTPNLSLSPTTYLIQKHPKNYKQTGECDEDGKQQHLSSADWLRMWSKKSLSMEATVRSNIAPSQLQLFQHSK